MNKNAEVKLIWDKLPNGKKVLRLDARHIPEELKNEFVKILGDKGNLKVVEEE